jgi:Na+/phosphate symporter
MGDNWTTVGLNQSMRKITRHTNKMAQEIMVESRIIKQHADELYQLFHTKHGLEKNKAADLDLSKLIESMHSLEQVTDDFCSSAVNIMTEKHFLIRKFFLSLGNQIKTIFEQAHADCERWLSSVIGELKNEIETHKSALDKRAALLMESHDSADKLKKNIAKTEQEAAVYQKQAAQLDVILLKLMSCVKFGIEKPKTAV